MVNNVKWEKNSGNENAIIHQSRILKRSHARLKAIAVKKMTDVWLISAEFEGEPKVFERLLWVLIEKDAGMEFFGIYSPAFLQKI